MNYTHKIEKDKLIIEVNLKAKTVPSKSGKSEVIASTHGNVELSLGDGRSVKMGLNVYRAA